MTRQPHNATLAKRPEARRVATARRLLKKNEAAIRLHALRKLFNLPPDFGVTK